MQYRITRYSHGHLKDTVTRKQFPAARRCVESAVWDMCHANGLLNRPIAYRLRDTAKRLSRDVHGATIALDAYAGSVTFEVIGG